MAGAALQFVPQGAQFPVGFVVALGRVQFLPRALIEWPDEDEPALPGIDRLAVFEFGDGAAVPAFRAPTVAAGEDTDVEVGIAYILETLIHRRFDGGAIAVLDEIAGLAQGLEGRGTEGPEIIQCG